MNRIQSTFERLKEQGRKALIPYITAGDPKPAVTPELMKTLRDAGADIIELGVPFSDPMADGPVIQLACERALEHNTSLKDVLTAVRAFREDDQQTPVVLMGYLNPVEAMGMQAFAERAVEAGVDGVLTVDLPPEEAEDVVPLYREHQLDSIFLIAPTTTEERIAAAAQYGGGYIYYVSLKGVTGAATLDVDDVQKHLAGIRNKTDMPLCVGFGIKDAGSAAAVSRIADGVIVGSALVQLVADHGGNNDQLHSSVHSFIKGIREAMDNA